MEQLPLEEKNMLLQEDQVQDIVYEKFHVKLEPEVRFLGIF